jgi:soluble lytic murein transglycosylase-like protein
MKRSLMLVGLAALTALAFPQMALAGHSEYDALISAQAAANNVPEALVHRIIVRESRYQPNLVGRCGCIGLMQIKLATARALGYTGDAQGLRDPSTNLTYGVKYLAGAYRAANGDQARAVHYYAAGYYEAAKRQRHAQKPLDLTPKQFAKSNAAMVPADAVGAAETRKP